MVFSRRQLLLAATSAVTACGHRDVARSSCFDDRIDALERKYNAYVGLFARDLASGRTLAHRENDPFAMCSTFKAYAVACALQRSQRGLLDLQHAVFVDPALLLPNSPVTGPRAGNSMPLTQLCAAALQYSDNAAANLILQAIGGPPAVTEFARSIGDDRTRLDRWETDLNTAIPGDPRDTSTPLAYGGGIQSLLIGTHLDEPRRPQLEEWMRGNVTSSQEIRAGLPSGWTTADKTGTGAYGSTNDIGLAYGPHGERVLLSVMTRSQSTNPHADPLRSLVAEVTRSALPWLTGQA